MHPAKGQKHPGKEGSLVGQWPYCNKAAMCFRSPWPQKGECVPLSFLGRGRAQGASSTWEATSALGSAWILARYITAFDSNCLKTPGPCERSRWSSTLIEQNMRSPYKPTLKNEKPPHNPLLTSMEKDYGGL